ncbi:hypothetical protein ACYULU_08860 [Breznakiellaceae bacterium SP9]
MVKNKSTGAGSLVRIFGLIVALAAVMGLATCKNGILKGLNDGDDDVKTEYVPVPSSPGTPVPALVYSQRDTTPGSPQKQITLMSNSSVSGIYYTIVHLGTESIRTSYLPTGFTAEVGDTVKVFSSLGSPSSMLDIPVLGLGVLGSTIAPTIDQTVQVVTNTSTPYIGASGTTYAWATSAGAISPSLPPGQSSYTVNPEDYAKMIEVTVTGPGMSAQISTEPVEVNSGWTAVSATSITSTTTTAPSDFVNYLNSNPGDLKFYIVGDVTIPTSPAIAIVGTGSTKEIKGLGSPPAKLIINSGTGTSGITINTNATLILGDNLILTGDGDNLVTVKSNGTLILRGAQIGGTSTARHQGRGVLVGDETVSTNGGRFIMERGTISWNDSSSLTGTGTPTPTLPAAGAGVRLQGYGTFEMRGGEISNNTTTAQGGGVYGYVNTTFRMTAGHIKGNTAANGGGVSLGGNSHAYMTGGTIGGTTSDKNTATNGGGVYLINNAIFDMTAGTISGNTATNGGGVYIHATNATFNMDARSGSPRITNNSAPGGSGGGVCVNEGIFNALGASASQFSSLLTGGNTANNGDAVALLNLNTGFFYLPDSSGQQYKMRNVSYPLSNGAWFP